MQERGTLILVCGLPGAGKTTYAKRLEGERNGIRLCPDDWIEAILADPVDHVERNRLRDPIENLQWDLAQGFLRQGFTVILENGFWSAEERGLYALGAWELGARVELAHLEAPDFGSLWKRVSVRNETMTCKTFVMTEEELRESWNLFEPPTEEEMSFYDNGITIRQTPAGG
ncbi:MAG TPA: ATP-binding protein [Fimbriimonadaceae bacterium]|nr:ATP-binding protein [Fimbriimonadaceae bacterium]